MYLSKCYYKCSSHVHDCHHIHLELIIHKHSRPLNLEATLTMRHEPHLLPMQTCEPIFMKAQNVPACTNTKFEKCMCLSMPTPSYGNYTYTDVSLLQLICYAICATNLLTKLVSHDLSHLTSASFIILIFSKSLSAVA